MEEGEGGKEEVFQFSEGQLVEVRSDDEQLGHSWFTAKIVKLSNRKNKKSILVEYVHERPLNLATSVYVNESLIRPLPVGELPNQFLLGQVVDAFHRNGWQRGKVSAIHDDSRYTICLFYSRTEKYIDFRHKDLRVHKDWISGKWVQPHDEDIDTKPDQDDAGKNNLVEEESFCDSSRMSEQCLRKNVVAQSSSIPITDSDQWPCKRNRGKGRKCLNIAPSGQLYCDKHQLESKHSNERRRVGKKKSPFSTEADKGRRRIDGVGFKSPMENGGGTHLTPGSVETHGSEMNLMQQNSLSSDLVPESGGRKRKGSGEVFLNDKDEEIREENGMVKRQTTTIVEPHIDVNPEGIVSEDPKCQTSNTTQEISDVFPKEIIVSERKSNSADAQHISPATTGNLLDHQLTSQPNIVITSGEASKNSLDLTKGSEGQTRSDNDLHGPIETVLSDHYSNEVRVENYRLPFVKSHDRAWEILESMEVFRSMPQHPHFQPLQQTNEFFREGEAIGYMFRFATVAEETRRSTLDDSKSSLENKLNALPELETMGFNVEEIRAQLCKLLSAKDNQVELDVMLKQIEGEMLQEKHDADLLQKEILELEELISEMQSKCRRLVVEKQAKYSSTVALQERVCEVKKRIDENKVNAAAAPW